MSRFDQLPNRFLIYGLRDPRTLEIRYVGQSSRGMERPQLHQQRSRIFDKRGDSLHSQRWLRRLWAEGLKCEIVILQICQSETDLDAAERTWIAIGKEAGTLTNHTDGGGGMRGYKASQETREKQRKIQSTPEYKEKIRKAHIGKTVSPETREKLRASILSYLESHPHHLAGRTIPPQTREKMRQAALGRKMPRSAVEKTAAAHRGKKLSPEHVAKMRIACAVPKSPEGRENMRKGALKRWARVREERGRQQLVLMEADHARGLALQSL